MNCVPIHSWYFLDNSIVFFWWNRIWWNLGVFRQGLSQTYPSTQSASRLLEILLAIPDDAVRSLNDRNHSSWGGEWNYLVYVAVNIVPADGLALLGVRTSADTKMTRSGSLIHTGPAMVGLAEYTSGYLSNIWLAFWWHLMVKLLINSLDVGNLYNSLFHLCYHGHHGVSNHQQFDCLFNNYSD